MRKDFFFDSCGYGQIHVCRWEPESQIAGIVQIVHGIADYGARYDEFACFLNSLGFLVVAEDHMGHGLSTSAQDMPGYFEGGWFSAVADTYHLLEVTMQEFPNVPYVLFGHSMGSFMVETILQDHSDCGISGCILCGSGWQTELALRAGLRISEAACRIFGERNPNPRMQSLLFGAYNLRIEHPRTPYDWVNRVQREVDSLIQDPLRFEAVTAGLARDMLLGISYIQQRENLARMNTKLPILLVAGGDDPVGTFGDGVRKIAKIYDEVGIRDVTVYIYPLCRHEILNELNKSEVFQDIKKWLSRIIGPV